MADVDICGTCVTDEDIRANDHKQIMDDGGTFGMYELTFSDDWPVSHRYIRRESVDKDYVTEELEWTPNAHLVHAGPRSTA